MTKVGKIKFKFGKKTFRGFQNMGEGKSIYMMDSQRLNARTKSGRVRVLRIFLAITLQICFAVTPNPASAASEYVYWTNQGASYSVNTQSEWDSSARLVVNFPAGQFADRICLNNNGFPSRFQVEGKSVLDTARWTSDGCYLLDSPTQKFVLEIRLQSPLINNGSNSLSAIVSDGNWVQISSEVNVYMGWDVPNASMWVDDNQGLRSGLHWNVDLVDLAISEVTYTAPDALNPIVGSPFQPDCRKDCAESGPYGTGLAFNWPKQYWPKGQTFYGALIKLENGSIIRLIASVEGKRKGALLDLKLCAKAPDCSTYTFENPEDSTLTEGGSYEYGLEFTLSGKPFAWGQSIKTIKVVKSVGSKKTTSVLKVTSKGISVKFKLISNTEFTISIPKTSNSLARTYVISFKPIAIVKKVTGPSKILEGRKATFKVTVTKGFSGTCNGSYFALNMRDLAGWSVYLNPTNIKFKVAKGTGNLSFVPRAGAVGQFELQVWCPGGGSRLYKVGAINWS